jgi:hypothetical protein
MKDWAMDRRNFHRLTAAAISGIAAGAVLGCRKEGEPVMMRPPGDAAAAELHLCRGLNECKAQGKSKDNACRGQGTCATVKEHSCGGQNECKGLGGCGETVGANDCKTKGGCHVPLMEGAWETLRKKKEAEWAEKMVEAGAAPAK